MRTTNRPRCFSAETVMPSVRQNELLAEQAVGRVTLDLPPFARIRRSVGSSVIHRSTRTSSSCW